VERYTLTVKHDTLLNINKFIINDTRCALDELRSTLAVFYDGKSAKDYCKYLNENDKDRWVIISENDKYQLFDTHVDKGHKPLLVATISYEMIAEVICDYLNSIEGRPAQ
jgi:hypothetical protein